MTVNNGYATQEGQQDQRRWQPQEMGLKKKQATPEANAIIPAYQRLFQTGDGQAVLEDLLARFHDCALYTPGGIEGERETARRVARREVISYILRRLGQVADDAVILPTDKPHEDNL